MQFLRSSIRAISPSIHRHLPRNLSSSPSPSPSTSSPFLLDLSQPDGMNQLCARLASDGFAVVTNHKIPSHVLANLSSSARHFFNLPAKTKNDVHVTKGGATWSGFMPMGGEATHGITDEKQGYYFTGARQPCQSLGNVLVGENLWPEEAISPNFRSIHEEGMKYFRQLGYDITSALSLHSGIDLTSKLLHNTEAIELYRSFAYSKDCKSGIGAHSDYGYLTILSADTPGLQFRLEERADAPYIDVPFVPGGIVVGAGDLLDVVTGGMYKSRMHRVAIGKKNEKNEKTGEGDVVGRHSFILFFDPSPEFIVAPFVKHRVDMSDDAFIRWNRTAFASVANQFFGEKINNNNHCGELYPYALFLAKKLEKVLGQNAPKFAGAPSVSARFQISLAEGGGN